MIRVVLIGSESTGKTTLAVELDVRELDSVQACLDAATERWGHVDAWVNNAAVTVARSFFEIDPSEWDELIATNLRGTYFGCRVAGLHMRKRGAGRIVNRSSSSPPPRLDRHAAATTEPGSMDPYATKDVLAMA